MSERRKITFPSDGTHCAAWHYPGANGACVVMAPGIGVTKEAGTDMLAERFAEAGYTVLAFEYRRLGESGGQPRQVVRVREQLADWQAALACAKALPAVDPRRVAIWGFSVSGGHVLSVAARNPWLGAAVAHAPSVSGIHASLNAMRHFTPWALLKLQAYAGADLLSTRLFGRPILIPLYGERGEVASITTPDSKNGPLALNPGGRYDASWRAEVAAWSALRAGFYQRPGRDAAKIRVPLLVLEFQDDGVTPPGPAARAAERAPRGEVAKLPGGHYAALLDQHEASVEAILAFLDRHLAGEGAEPRRREEVAAVPSGGRRA